MGGAISPPPNTSAWRGA